MKSLRFTGVTPGLRCRPTAGSPRIAPATSLTTVVLTQQPGGRAGFVREMAVESCSLLCTDCLPHVVFVQYRLRQSRSRRHLMGHDRSSAHKTRLSELGNLGVKRMTNPSRNVRNAVRFALAAC